MSASSFDTGLPRGEGRLARRRVQRLARAVALVGQERRLVHEQLGSGRGLDDGCGRRRVARDHDLPSCARLRRGRPRLDDTTARERRRLSPRWSTPRSRPGGHAQPVRNLDVEAARSLVLDERVADRRDPVVTANASSR